MPAASWRPHPGPQTEFFARGEFEVLYGGAAGGGKTDALILDGARNIDHPRYHALVLRRTYKQLQEIIDRCWIWYPLMGGDYSSTLKRWQFPSGSIIDFGHMQHEDDKYNYQGKEFHYVGFDELTQFTETQYLYLFSRCRTTDPKNPTIFRATTNPGGIGHYWVKARFIDTVKPYEPYIDPATGLSRAFIPARVYDNPSIMDNDPGYIKRLEALPELEKLRLLEGVWDAFEGQVFTELSQRVHGCNQFDIPPEWERYVVFDWGYGKPWCALWFAVDFDGVIYLYREYYGMRDGDFYKGLRMSNSEICRAIHQIEMGQHEGCPFPAERGRIRMRIADPACWSKTKIGGRNTLLGPSFYEDAAREGLVFVKADNNRLLGKQQVHQRLRLEEDIDPKTGEVLSEHPRFLAFNTCKDWWREMQNLREDPKNVEDVDTDQPDHGYDCTRYMFMSRPVSPRTYKPGPPPGSFAAERNRLIKARKLAARKGISIAEAYSRVR